MLPYFERRLKVTHLRTVDALLRHGSLVRAAVPLGVSQPALTRTLHEVEEMVGQTLFERTPRGMRPSEAGRLVGAAAARVLCELHRLQQDLVGLTGDADSTIAVGTLPVAAAGILPGAIQFLRRSAPTVRVRLTEGRSDQLMGLLAVGEVDLVLGRLYRPALPDGHLREVLWSEAFAVLARPDHPICDGRTVTVAELRRHTILLPTIGQRIGQEVEHMLDLLELGQNKVLRSNSASFVREMLYGTEMIAIMPHLLMVTDLMRGTLKSVSLPIDLPAREAGVVLAGNRPRNSATDAFLAALRAYLAATPICTRQV